MYAIQLLREILLAIAAAVPGLVHRSPKNSELEDFVPVEKDLLDLLAANPPDFETKIGEYYDKVKADFIRVDTDPVLRSILVNSRARQSAMTGNSVKWNTSNLGKRPTLYYDKLSSDQKNVSFAIELLGDIRSAALDTIKLNDTNAKKAINQLSWLHDMLLRLIFAKGAQDLAPNLTIAEILALSKTEGNLAVPRSLRRIELLVPSMEKKTNGKYVIQPSILERNSPTSPNLGAEIYLDDESFIGNTTIAKEYALKSWMVQIAGWDYVARHGFEQWSADNWSHYSGTLVSPASRLAVYNSLLANMTVMSVNRDATGMLVYTAGMPSLTGTTQYICVVPTDEELLVSTILADSALFLRRGGSPAFLTNTTGPTTGFAPDYVAPPRYSYAMYNLQVGGADGSVKEAFYLSAITYAYQSKKSRWKPLRDLIKADANLLAVMQSTIHYTHKGISKSAKFPQWVKDVSVITQADINTHFPAFRNWLMESSNAPQHIARVSEFIENADKTDWPSWDKAGLNGYRSNANRYHLLYRYFHLLTGETEPF